MFGLLEDLARSIGLLVLAGVAVYAVWRAADFISHATILSHMAGQMADILPFAIPHGRLRAVVQPELAERGSEHGLDRPGSYIEFPRNRLVRSPISRQQAEYVALAGRQADLAADVILLGWMGLCVAVGFFIAWTARQVGLSLIPVDLSEANAFVAEHHRHHKPVIGHKFSIGATLDEKIVGIAIIGRPVARRRDDGMTLEVTRLCTDGTRNACSFLYGAAARATFALGFRRIGTYILASEPGTSLTGAGWRLMGETGGGSWSRGSRPRVDTHPLQTKLLFEAVAQVREHVSNSSEGQRLSIHGFKKIDEERIS